MSKDFDISEINKLCKEIEKQGGNIRSAIKKGVLKTTHFCESMAKRNAPVKEGTLRASIFSEVKEQGRQIIGNVQPTVEYAVYPEFGTGQRGMASKIERPEGIHYNATWKGQDAHPYMYPAYLSSRDKLLPNIEKELNKVLKGGC